MVFRGNEFAKNHFGKTFEGFEEIPVDNQGIVMELKPLHRQRRMAGATETGIAAVIIHVIMKGGRRNRSRRGDLYCYEILYRGDIFKHTVDGCAHHYHEEKLGKKMKRNPFLHIQSIMSSSLLTDFASVCLFFILKRGCRFCQDIFPALFFQRSLTNHAPDDRCRKRGKQ